jgi:hypothetical protein
VTVCIGVNRLNPSSFYPVVDPRRTAGPGPYAYGYGFAWDVVIVYVERISALQSCEMTVVLKSSLSETKEIQAWNYYANNIVDSIYTFGSGQPISMTIRKAGATGQACGTGGDTLVLCRHFAWPRGRTALYCFPAEDLWDFWGGCRVTFDWRSDTVGSGIWGSNTPAPTYPFVRFPDGTFVSETIYYPGDYESTRHMVVLGGGGFIIGYGDLPALGLIPGNAISVTGFPLTPADGVLVRESGRPEVYVVYGGAKFWIPDPPTLFRLGFNWSQVRIIPAGGSTSQLRTMPIGGTLIKEEHDPKVYLVDNGALRWVTSPTVMSNRCLPWRHVRTVPDGSLTNLPRGSDLTS